MRFSPRNTLTLLTLAGAAVVYSGCEAKQQTEYVAGVSTQVQIPRDIKTIRVDVSVGGANVFCRAYRVYDGRVQLPRSLGSFPATDRVGEPISFTVVGFTEELTDASRLNEYECLKEIRSGQNARVLRRSRQPYVKDEILFLPMALRYSCFDKDCETAGQDKTCKAGRCVDAVIDEKKLPKWSDDLLDGSGSTCFNAAECFVAGVPPVVVDANDCTYAIPNTPSSPNVLQGAPANPVQSAGDGINVEITYDGGLNKEILDKDPEEGFTVPDPTKPQRFRLTPGLCDLVKGVDDQGKPTAHRITSIRATGLCRAKSPFQPLCTADQLAAMGTPGGVSTQAASVQGCSSKEIKPSKSVLMILADDSTNHQIFYNGADRAAFEISLSDPAFQKTDIGLTFFPGNGTCPATFPATVAPTAAVQARDAIGLEFKNRGGDAPVTALKAAATTNLDGALAATYQALQADAYKDFNRRAVLVLTNRDWDNQTCSAQTPVARATAAKANARSVNTYVVALARQPSDDLNALPPLPAAAFQLATAGGLVTNPEIYDARKDKERGQSAFRRVVEDLATCAYDLEGEASAANTDVLSFSDPVAPPPPGKATYTIAFNGACNSDAATSTAQGWGVDAANPKRIRLCGTACTDYRKTLEKAAGYAGQYGQPALAVPVFLHKQGCEPK